MKRVPPILLLILALCLASCSAPNFLGGQPDPFDVALGQAVAAHAQANAAKMSRQ